jgi:hypothetical protein
MSALEDIKESKLQNSEYDLDDGRGSRAVETIPLAAVGTKERVKPNSVHNLNVVSQNLHY